MNMKAMHKDFWMEIRKSKARFISIFMIVALGVAFFSGIQASSPDMRFSGDAYYDETNLMDIKVMGTLGLTEDDVAAIKQVDGVENAEGAYGTDVMCGEGEKQKVLHVEAVDQTMNRISVTEGKAPEKSGEIFLDCIFAESNGYQVGDQITLKEGGDSELLKKTDYTVVGLGESPLYISYNRGNSTLGSGEVNGFAYVLPEDFDQEVYTQIYVQAHGAQDLISYTDAYDSLIERVQERVEGIEAERCQVRYDEIVEEANDKLADARQELEDGKKEANEKLAAIEGKEKRPGRSERKISLAVDIQAKLAAGKGPGYERWAKVFNIKQMAAALAYIQDNNLTDYEQLAKKATEAADRFHVISEQVKQTEQAMKTNAGLKAATVQYAKTRPVFEQYKATKYSRKFLAEHEADLELYRAAQAEMRSLLGGAKLPKMDVLKEEGRKLTAKKKQLYGEYQKARRDMQEIVTIKANIDTLMGYTEPGRKQEKER